MDHFYYLFIICGNAACTALPAGYKGFGGTDYIAPILLSRFLQSINRNRRALHENRDGYLHPLAPAMVAVTTAFFFIASPRNSYWKSTEVSKMACLTRIITTNITTKILSEINQEMGELKTMVL